ncbi:MAG: phosphoglycolate phosphatase [Methyloligellaceae bacterium]
MHYRDASIVFDLDGTLVESAPDLLGATNHVMQHISCPEVGLDIIRPIVSNGAKAMMFAAASAGDRHLSDEELQDLNALFLEYYSNNAAVNSYPYEGVVGMLKMIRDAGGKLGICTNKNEMLAHRVLEGLNLHDYFDAIIGRDTLGVHKPHPEHLLGTIGKIGGNAKKAIMIGDSAPDIQAAKAAGIPVVAVSFGYTEIPVQELSPDAIINSYEELPEVLFSLLSSPDT